MILNTNGGIINKRPNLTLLWTNTKPTTAVAASTKITLDLGGYTFLYIVFLTSTTEHYLNVSAVVNDINITNQIIVGEAGKTKTSRIVTISNDSITLSTGYCTTVSDTLAVSNTTSSKYAIPYRIYGMLA